MITKNILIISNGQNNFTTWSTKTQWVAGFYSSLLSLQFDLKLTNFINVPVKEGMINTGNQAGPFSTPIEAYSVDMAWYEANIDPLTGSHDCDVLAINTSDVDPPTGLLPAGITCGSYNGVGQITIFCQPGSENWPASQNGVIYPNAIALEIAHEISHWLAETYGAPIDRTHEFFYSNNIAGVIPWLQSIMQNQQTTNSIAVYNQAKICLGDSLVPAGDNPELGCAISVSVLLNKAGVKIPETVSTAILLQELENSPLMFTEVTAANVLPGDIIISATGTSTIPNTPITNGHTGVVAKYGICSNNSTNGIWSENFTLATWDARYAVQGGYPVRFFRAK